MSQAYSTQALAAEEIKLSFLLVDAARCGISWPKWERFCRQITEWRGAVGLHDDVFVVSDANGRMRGLFATQVVQSLLLGRVFEVPLFISLSAADEEGVSSDMLKTLQVKAREANCVSIRIWSRGGESWERAIDAAGPFVRYQGAQLALG